MTDEEMTQRERRAQRHKKGQDGGSRKAAKALLGYLVVLAAAGGAIGLTVVQAQQEDPACPGNDYRHYHPGFLLMVNGTRVPLTDPSFYQFSGSVPFHIHADDGILHIEPGSAKSCVETSQVLRKLAMDITPGRLVLGPEHGANAGTYADDPEQGLAFKAYHKTYFGEWEEISPNRLNNRILHPGEQVLLTYGALDEETLAAQKEQVPEPQGPFPETSFPLVPIIGISTVAALALFLWYSFTKRA